MPRQPRLEFPGAFYHVYSRGNEKRTIFRNDHDRSFFLETFGDIVEEFGWTCHGYCLMDNHYHLVIETPEPNLSGGMHRLNSLYCMGFNRKYDRVGHLLQGRFHSPVVKDDNHMLAIIRYIAQNPVTAGLVSRPIDWRWSSYCAIAGLIPAPPFLNTDFVLRLFSDDVKVAREAYINHVAQVKDADGGSDPEGRQPLCALFGFAEDKHHRNLLIREAHRKHGYSPAEIANHLGVNRTTIFRVLKD